MVSTFNSCRHFQLDGLQIVILYAGSRSSTCFCRRLTTQSDKSFLVLGFIQLNSFFKCVTIGSKVRLIRIEKYIALGDHLKQL